VIPTDLLCSLSKEAATAVQLCEKVPDGAFAAAWQSGKTGFLPVKFQYERLLRALPEERSNEWKMSMGIIEKSAGKLESSVET
jgi:hypothetical protein